jgi:putative membrane protein
MKFRQIRIIVLGTSVILSPLALLAQGMPQVVPPSQTQPNLPQQQQPGVPSMQDSGTNANEVAQTMRDKAFLRHAAEGGIAEVKFGQLAAQKAASPDVKAFGQKMVDDHTMLNSDMAPIADSMGVRVPTTISKEDQAEYDKLNSLSGNDFDIEYLTIMVRDHHKDFHDFRAEATSVTDPTLQAAVIKATKVIHEHTVMVDKLARDKGVSVPTHGGNRPPAPAL